MKRPRYRLEIICSHCYQLEILVHSVIIANAHNNELISARYDVCTQYCIIQFIICGVYLLSASIIPRQLRRTVRVTTTVISSVIHGIFRAVSPNTTLQCVRALEVILYATGDAPSERVRESTISIGNYNGNLSDLLSSLIRVSEIRVRTVFKTQTASRHTRKLYRVKSTIDY